MGKVYVARHHHTKEDDSMRKSLLLAMAGILAIASVASAANKEGQFSVSPVIGGYTYEGKQHLDTSLIYGLRGGYNFTKNFGVEALFDYVNTEPTTSKNDVDIVSAENCCITSSRTMILYRTWLPVWVA